MVVLQNCRDLYCDSLVRTEQTPYSILIHHSKL